MKPHILLTLALSLCLASVALADDKADLETGTWKLAGINKNGQTAPPEFIAKSLVRFVFKDDKLTITAEGDSKEGTFKIDASKAPREMDMKMDKDADKAIYALDKDSLRIAIGVKDRPKNLDGGPDIIVFTLERVK